jgi:Na+-transporting NADH:ubiquinone oxidoreductase subunit C
VRSDTYTFFFAAAVCTVCSLLLAFSNMALKPYQDKNVEIDRQKNVLMSLALYDAAMTTENIESTYKTKIREKIIDNNGDVVSGKTIKDVEKNPELFSIFERIEDGAFAISIQGLGLWKLIRGYFALENDGKTVLGVTFYEQGETPGLGAEIENEWFTNNFKGKSILNSKNELVAISIVKGKAVDVQNQEQNNIVDGISGATMTGKGINIFLLNCIKANKKYLEKIWKKSSALADKEIGQNQQDTIQGDNW